MILNLINPVFLSYFKEIIEIVNLTIELLRKIGQPFPSTSKKPIPSEDEIQKLYLHAIKNRIPLLYLEILKKQGKLAGLVTQYNERYTRHLKIYDLMALVSKLLSYADIEHAVFKSIRPYPTEASDVDVLILDSNRYGAAIKTMSKAGYDILGYGPQSITFYDPIAHAGIDLYREVALSYIIYLDKRKLFVYATKRELPNNQDVNTLMPEGDLVAIIAHSMLKEQMYTLAEYYTFLNHLAKMSTEKIDDFIELAKTNGMISAVKSFCAITTALHTVAFQEIPRELQMLANAFDSETFERKRLEQRMFETPHKYHMLTIARVLLEKLRKEEKTRESMALQIFKMSKPSFARSIFRDIIYHLRRQTY